MPITFLDEEDNTGIDDTSLIPSIQPKKRKVTFLDEEPEEEKPEEQGILRQVADIPLGIARGGVTGIKMMTDILGADNTVSKSLAGVEGYMADLMSAQAKEDQQEISRIMKDAEDKGFGEQVKAGIKAFSIAPVDIMSQALGTMAPVVATGLVGSAAKLGVLGMRAVQAGVGAGMGAGMIKGEIYNEVKNELVNSGITEDAAEKTAIEAQSYGGKNLDQILLGAGLGAASTIGAEGIITRILTKQGTAPAAGVVSRVLKGGLTEAVPEAAQAAQEQIAKNVALQREGFDIDPSRGIVAAATMEAVAAAPLGGIAGAVESPAPIKTLAEENLEQTNEIARKVAGNGAPLTASAIQDQAAIDLRQDELAKQLSDDLNVDREVKVETQTPTTKEEVAANLSEEDLNLREQDAKKLVQQYKDAYFESQDPNDQAKAVEFQGVLDAIQAEKQKRKAAPTEAAEPTNASVIQGLSEEDLNAYEQDLNNQIEQKTNAYNESFNAFDISEIDQLKSWLNETQVEKRKRSYEKGRSAPTQPQAIKPLPTDYLPTETPGAAYGRESEVYDVFANVPRKTTEAATLPVEQAPLTQQAVAQSIEKSVAQQIETQPYATQEIIQPEGIRQEPQDGTQIREKPQTIISDSVLSPATSQEEGQVIPTSTAEQETLLGEAKSRYDSEIATYKNQRKLNLINDQELGKKLKAAGMQFSAEKRKVTGQLTDKEFEAEAKRKASNYIGKPVEVDGKLGKVIGNPFGRVKVKLDDGGTTITTTSDKVTDRLVAESTQTQAPLPKLTPTERRAEIESAPVSATPAVTSIPSTGKPFEFFSIRNKEKSPQLGARFGQDIEPHGKYMAESTPRASENLDNRFEKGSVRFENPLVVDFGGGYGTPTNWKNVLSSQYGGKTGLKLTKAIRDAGYDGIVTIEPSKGPNRPAYTSEIVDIRSIKSKVKATPSTATTPAPVAETPVVTEAPLSVAEPTVKISRSEDFSMTGDYNVSIGDKKHRIYKDSESGVWYDADVRDNAVKNNDPAQGSPSLGLLTTETRKDAIAELVNKYKKEQPTPAVSETSTVEVAPTTTTRPAQEDVKVSRYRKFLGESAPQAISEAKNALASFNRSNYGKLGDNPFQAEPRLRELKNVISSFVGNRLSVTNQKADEIAEQIILGKPNIVDKVMELKPIKAKELDDIGAIRSSITRFGYEQDDKKTYRHPRESEAISTTPAVSETITPATSAGLQVGQRVRSGSTPQPFVITEVTPQTARDVELGEQYYQIKNERTGEVSVVESVDITPVKTTRSSKKLKAVYPSKGGVKTDVRQSKARDKAKYRQKYKSTEVLTKINNYIKNGLVEMKEAGDNGNVELIEEISKKIDFASKYNINESELYSEKELEDGVRNFFKGNIPSNVIFTNDIGDDSYASYVLNAGEIEINRAYFKRNVNIDAIIGHELGHFAFGDPEFQKIFTSFWDDLTQEQRDAISEYVEENYSALSPDLRNEEKVIRAWQALLEVNPEIRSKWANFVEAVKRFLNKYFSTSYEVNDSDKFVLNVLNAIRQDFISGKKMLREDGTDFKLQAKAQVHGQKEAGRELNSFIGGEKIVQDIVRQNYFDSTQFNDENTQKAYDLLQSLTDFTDGNNNDFAIKLNEDIQSKLKDQDVHPDIKQVIGVQILRNELQRYSNKLLVAGDSFFEKRYKLNANDIPLGIKDVTSSNIARALGAIAKINNPMIGAIQAQGKGEVVQLASTTFGTKEPSTEQINVIEEALKESGKAETIDNADILDSVVSVESKTGVNIRKDIDAAIKKSGVKPKTIDNIIGSTETGKTEFAGVDASTAKASIKKQATSPIDAQAERAIEGLAKLQSDVQEWPNKTQNQVRSIVQQDLRQRPDMGRKEAWKSLLTSKLMNAGVSESNAMTLSDLIWKQHEINNMNREIKLIESAAENGSLGVIVEMIKNTPLQQQSTPEWRKEVIRQYLMSAGLSEKQAESAARLYDNIIAEKIAEAKQKAFEDSISKTSPWRDHMSRNGQLAKDALKKVLSAVRTSALDPTQNTESIIAKQNGWTGFSEGDFRRIAEIDEILNSKDTDELKKAELMKELNEIISKTKLPVTVKQALAAFYTGQALMGIPTVTVNVFSPLGLSLRNLITDIGRFAVTDPSRIPLAFDVFLESMRSWYNQTKYAFKNEVYPNDVVEYLNGNNVLKDLYNKGKREWKNGDYASGMRDMLVGMTQITGRVLSALDQGAISAIENQNINRYAIEAMSLSNIPSSKRNAVARQILQAKRNTYINLIASGMEKERAGVLSDMEMKNEIKKQLSSLNIETERVNDVINSAINDALLSVGRNRTLSMDGLVDEQKRLSDNGVLSYPPIKFLEQIASSSAQQGPLMQIFSKMLYGFALVPARGIHFFLWYSPYGFLRIYREKKRAAKGLEPNYALSLGNELQYRQRLTESIAGTIVILGLSALVKSSTDDDDDKFKIVVTGNGPDAAADKQYYDSWIKKWKPYSIHIVMGDTVIPINIGRGGESILFPILIAGALDDWKIRNQMNKAKKKPADLNQAAVMLGSVFLALAQRGPYAAFGKSLFNANRAGQLPEEVASQLGYFGKTFIPIVGTSLARNISDFINDPIDRSSMSGAIYSNIPIVGPMIGTKALNAFGQPIRADDWGDKLFKLGVPMVFSFPKNTPMNALNELVLSKGDGPTIPTRRIAESRLERPMTNEEFYAYVKTYGDSVSKSMFRSRKSLERMDASRYQSQLEEYSKDANERATRVVKRMSMR